jgi:hypothetical protein
VPTVLKLGVSTSWNPQGLSRPVKGLLYLLITPNNSFQLHTSLFTKYSGQQEISEKERSGKTAVKQSSILRKTRLASTKY